MVRVAILGLVAVDAARKRVAPGDPKNYACTEASSYQDDGSTFASGMWWYAGKTHSGNFCRPTCIDETTTANVMCCSSTDPAPGNTNYETKNCSDASIGLSNVALWATRKASGTCASAMTYANAKAHCTSNGGRLCTEQEAWNWACLSCTYCAGDGSGFMWVESDTSGSNGGVCSDYPTGGTPDRDASFGSTNRNGASSSANLAAPSAITGDPYQDAMNEFNDAGGNYDDAAHTADTTVTAKNSTDSSACSAKGFLCDFSQHSQLGVYNPLDFVWKVVDPLDHNVTLYERQTLSCTVPITAAGPGKSADWFYIPTGQDNAGSTDYCDIESIRRVVNNDNLNMTDTIRVRGETARMNNGDSSSKDLVGEMFDLVCTCTTALSTEASLDGVKQADLALLTVMTSTGQSRDLPVQMHLYSNEAMTDAQKVEYPQTFPDDEPFFFFLVRHFYDNDWDVKLQINACVVCDLADDCTTKTTSDDAVFFYDGCSTLLGGPQEKAAAGWYAETNGNTIPTEWLQGRTKWANSDPNTCPYAALGVSKFRITGMNLMQVTCQITGCDSLPCKPCRVGDTFTRNPRRILGQRQLQEVGNVDVSAKVRLAPSTAANSEGETQYDQADKKRKKKASAVSIVLLVLFILLLFGSLVLVRYMLHQKHTEEKKVQPTDPSDEKAVTVSLEG